MHCYPSLGGFGQESLALLGFGGLVAPDKFANTIGGVLPIALFGLSSLPCLRQSSSFSQAPCRVEPVAYLGFKQTGTYPQSIGHFVNRI
jgi:hypothetical protein